jgi:S1-C subfamily serine protease
MRDSRILAIGVTFFIAATIVCAGRTPSLAQSPEAIEEDETVIIIATDRVTERIGAGVVVSKSGSALVVATAAHNVATGGLIVETQSGARLNVLKVEPIPGFDLALLTTSAYVGPVFTATFGSPTLGAAVHVWGHRIERPYVESSGSILDLDPLLPEGPANGRFAIDCQSCGHGDSGGGVFDGDGRLIGILEGARRDSSGQLAFVQCEPIAPLEAPTLILAMR